MATGYRTFNTNVNGSALLAALNADDVRALEFDAVNKQPAVKTFSSGETGSLTVEQWMQAALAQMPLATTDTSNVNLNLGPDTVTQAALYQSLFDIKTLNDQRTLRFVNAGSVASQITLQNSSGTALYVQVQSTGTASSGSVMFSSSITFPGTTGAYYGQVGAERIVVLKPTSITAGSQGVRFTILPYSV